MASSPSASREARAAMIEAPHYSAAGVSKKADTLPEALFDGTVKKDVLHLAVITFLSNQRQGTSDTKTRSEVSGGNQKPWRQKGTGRARQGSTRAPHWRHGGIVFGPHPRDYRLGIPKKVRQLAKKSALNARAREEALFVVDSLEYEKPKTKTLAELLGKLGVATKPQIRAAIETLVKVTVTDVRTLVVRARRRTGGLSSGRAGRRSAWKKAIVTLKEGDAIAVFEG